RKRLISDIAVQNSGLISDQHSLNYELGSSDEDGRFTSTGEDLHYESSEADIALTGPLTDQPYTPSVLRELIMLSLPAVAGQVIEPLAQLVGTAYVGRLDGRISFRSVSTALALSFALGILEAAAMTLGSGVFLNIMGVSKASPIRFPAEYFLRLRPIGAPAVVISLAIQGIFLGFKDTRTPVLCLGIGNLAAVFLFPVSMYIFHLVITGAAISTVASQWFHFGKNCNCCDNCDLEHLNGCPSWSFICCCSSDMLVEAQASAGQGITAEQSQRDHLFSPKGLLTGVSLAIILGLSLCSLAKLFTTDTQVQNIIGSLLLFVSASQPLSALAYIFDGLHYGVSDFPYAGCSMLCVVPIMYGYRGNLISIYHPFFLNTRSFRSLVRFDFVHGIALFDWILEKLQTEDVFFRNFKRSLLAENFVKFCFSFTVVQKHKHTYNQLNLDTNFCVLHLKSCINVPISVS
ncbi:hypothetical protein ACH5RR_011935, partial [Cinchona calisaya]